MPHTRFGGRTLARSQALQLLFQAEIAGRSVDDVLAGDYALSDGPLDPYGEELARGVDACRHDLDRLISGASSNWSVGRMPAVDRNLLRIGLFEMLHEDDVATAVAIDEVVELAKAYGTDESSRFINGVLGKVSRTLEEEAASAEAGGEDAGSRPDDAVSRDGANPEDGAPATQTSQAAHDGAGQE